jgi:hypothetical protein
MNENGNIIEVKDYKCSTEPSRDEVDKTCASLTEFDCTLLDNNLNTKLSNIKKDGNINRNKIETSAGSMVKVWPLYIFVTLTLICDV